MKQVVFSVLFWFHLSCGVLSHPRGTSTTHNSTLILKRLRELMQKEDLQAYLITGQDAHGTGHDMNKRRQFMTGFTGSTGEAIVTENQAVLWTNGIYWSAAQKQVDAEWTVMDYEDKMTWLLNDHAQLARVGVDPRLISADRFASLSGFLSKISCELVAVPGNLVDIVQEEAGDMPAPRNSTVFVYPLAYAGVKSTVKIENIKWKMNEHRTRTSISLLVVSALDEVAWLLNLRGSDVPNNPVFFSYAVVSHDNVDLFVNQRGLQPDVLTYLTGMGVRVHEYDSLTDELAKLLEEADKADGNSEADLSRVWLPPSTNQAIASLVPPHRRYDQQSPVQTMKAVKNEVELQGMRNSHLRDAVAHCEFFQWLEREMQAGDVELTEIDVASRFEQIRSNQSLYMSLSFDTISAVGPHAAMPHYKPTPETDATLSVDEVYLVDSGAQYMDGTIDTTRTVAFGEPSLAESEAYTRVLKGHINLARFVFPNYIKGREIEPSARAALWEVGLDYRHGTGHGLGHFLYIHEGPTPFGDEALEPGRVLTIEPGYYLDNEFGIRIESAYEVVVERMGSGSDQTFLGFRALTLVSIQRRLIDVSLLTMEERSWIDEYHRRCAKEVGAELERQGKTEALEWLIENTKPLDC